jgi:predicted ATPase
MDTLGSLVDSSLVRPQTHDGEPRFGLLETIREYALERLRDGAGWREAHDRTAASCCRVRWLCCPGCGDRGAGAGAG